MKIYKYSDLYSSETMKLFADYLEGADKKIGDMEIIEDDNEIHLDNKLGIDIDKILDVLHIRVEKDYTSSFSSLVASAMVISCTADDPKYEKAYQLAQLLARNEKIFLHRSVEQSFERIAYDIILPRKLIAVASDLYQRKKNLTDDEFEKENPTMFTILLSRWMNVPLYVMRQRLIDLGVLVSEQ